MLLWWDRRARSVLVVRHLTHAATWPFRDVADVRERDGGLDDITVREQIEEVVGIILKMLAF